MLGLFPGVTEAGDLSSKGDVLNSRRENSWSMGFLTIHSDKCFGKNDLYSTNKPNQHLTIAETKPFTDKKGH